MRDVIVGKFPVPDKAGRQSGLEEDQAGQAAFTSVFDAIKFQSDYLNHLADLTGGGFSFALYIESFLFHIFYDQSLKFGESMINGCI